MTDDNDPKVFYNAVAEFLSTSKGAGYSSMIGLRGEGDDRTLKYMKITVKAYVEPWGPALQKEPTYEKFTAFYNDWKAKAPDGMKDFTHAS